MKRFMTISQHNRPPHHEPRVIVSLLLAALSLMLIACGDNPGGDISLAEFHNSSDTRIITFNKNEGTGDAPNTIVAKRYQEVTLPDQENLELNGHVFAGWKDDRGAYDRTSKTYAAGDRFVLGDSDVLLYADWRRLYTITFDANSGTSQQPVTSGEGMTVTILTGSDVTRNGYTLNGWNTRSDGNGTNHNAGASYTVTGDVTLYAMWTLATYTISYNLDGGSVSTANPVNYNITSDTITLNNPTKTGYTFDGWTGSNGTTPQTTVTIPAGSTENNTYTANWTPISYVITYNANDGNGTTPSPQTADFGSSITLPSGDDLSRSGYTFGGWNTNSDGTGTNYNAGASYAVTGDVTLYANWSAIIYTVTFNVNGGSGTTPSPQTAISGSSITLPSGSSLSRSGHTFGGWNTNNSGTGTNYNAGASYAVTGDVTLYAKWNTITYTLTVNAGTGGTVSPSGTYTLNAGTQIQVCAYPSTGYTFSGWSGASTSTSSCVTMTMNGDRTLTANFERITYTLTVSASPSAGGSVSRTPSQTSYNAGASVTVTATAASGYTFTGWSGASTSTSSSVTVTMNGNQTLTANFEVIPPTTETFTDARDGQSYRFVTIGNQTWMAENLNFETADSWCYGDNSANCNTYGRLYTWYAAMSGSSTSSANPSGVQGVCPAGWHLPSDAEWTELVNFVGGSYVAGSKLKSQTGWTAYSGISSTDEFGFSALPGGGRYSDDFFFYDAGYFGNWWSSTESDGAYARIRDMVYGNDDVGEGIVDKLFGLSVRCVMN